MTTLSDETIATIQPKLQALYNDCGELARDTEYFSAADLPDWGESMQYSVIVIANALGIELDFSDDDDEEEE